MVYKSQRGFSQFLPSPWPEKGHGGLDVALVLGGPGAAEAEAGQPP